MTVINAAGALAMLVVLAAVALLAYDLAIHAARSLARRIEIRSLERQFAMPSRRPLHGVRRGYRAGE